MSCSLGCWHDIIKVKQSPCCALQHIPVAPSDLACQNSRPNHSSYRTGQPKADVVEAVHEKLRGVGAALSAGQLPLSAFVITKQLTKRPEDYPDAKGQPHVQVRHWRRIT